MSPTRNLDDRPHRAPRLRSDLAVRSRGVSAASSGPQSRRSSPLCRRHQVARTRSLLGAVEVVISDCRTARRPCRWSTPRHDCPRRATPTRHLIGCRQLGVQVRRQFAHLRVPPRSCGSHRACSDPANIARRRYASANLHDSRSDHRREPVRTSCARDHVGRSPADGARRQALQLRSLFYASTVNRIRSGRRRRGALDDRLLDAKLSVPQPPREA